MSVPGCLGTQPETAGPTLSFECSCGKRPPGDEWCQTQTTSTPAQLCDFIWTITQACNNLEIVSDWNSTSTHLKSYSGVIRNNLSLCMLQVSASYLISIPMNCNTNRFPCGSQTCKLSAVLTKHIKLKHAIACHLSNYHSPVIVIFYL